MKKHKFGICWGVSLKGKTLKEFDELKEKVLKETEELIEDFIKDRKEVYGAISRYDLASAVVYNLFELWNDPEGYFKRKELLEKLLVNENKK